MLWKEQAETDQSTSKPLLAATLCGMLRVWRGSTTPRVGLMALLAIPGHQSQLTQSHVRTPPTSINFTCFCLQGLKVEDGDAGGLAAGSCGGRN